MAKTGLMKFSQFSLILLRNVSKDREKFINPEMKLKTLTFCSKHQNKFEICLQFAEKRNFYRIALIIRLSNNYKLH